MKTIIHKRTIKGIKTLEYSSKKADKLLFLQHGIHSQKEKVMHLLGVSFVKLGYHVVAIDAAKHGARIEEPFLSKDEDLCELETMYVVKQTSEDIKNIYEDTFRSEFDGFDFIGVSMGGLIGYYLSTITDQIDQLVALISSPKFLEAAQYTFPEARQKKYPEQTKTTHAFIESIDPSTRPESMVFNRLIMLNGTYDRVIPSSQSETFLDENPQRNIIFRCYETGHKIVQKMHKDLLAYLKNK